MTERIRAEFEGMYDEERSRVIAKGPYTVEIFESTQGKSVQFEACIVAGRVAFWEMRDVKKKNGSVELKQVLLRRPSIGDMRTLIEFRFAKKLKDWYDAPAVPEPRWRKRA